MTARLPTIKDLAELVRHVKAQIDDEYRASDDEDDDVPGIQLTVGWSDETGEWSYQTGDNSYMGSAYHYPHWAVVDVYRSTNSREVARDLRAQLDELTWG